MHNIYSNQTENSKYRLQIASNKIVAAMKEARDNQFDKLKYRDLKKLLTLLHGCRKPFLEFSNSHENEKGVHASNLQQMKASLSDQVSSWERENRKKHSKLSEDKNLIRDNAIRNIKDIVQSLKDILDSAKSHGVSSKLVETLNTSLTVRDEFDSFLKGVPDDFASFFNGPSKTPADDKFGFKLAGDRWRAELTKVTHLKLSCRIVANFAAVLGAICFLGWNQNYQLVRGETIIMFTTALISFISWKGVWLAWNAKNASLATILKKLPGAAENDFAIIHQKYHLDIKAAEDDFVTIDHLHKLLKEEIEEKYGFEKMAEFSRFDEVCAALKEDLIQHEDRLVKITELLQYMIKEWENAHSAYSLNLTINSMKFQPTGAPKLIRFGELSLAYVYHVGAIAEGTPSE